jgi:hypothetical protein
LESLLWGRRRKFLCRSQAGSRCRPLLPRGHGRTPRRTPLSRDPWRGELLPYGQQYICTLIGRHLSLTSIIRDGQCRCAGWPCFLSRPWQRSCLNN